jgi:CHRD domain
MKKKLSLATLLVGAVTMTAVFGMHALAGGGQSNFEADVLTGYQEAAAPNGPGAISTPASGAFEAKLDGDTLSYTLTYSGLTTAATQAHIHFGNRVQNGSIIVFLCGGAPPASTKPACPAGTTDEAVVNGTITAADITGSAAAQGIAAGELQELVDALRAGVAYANVHSSTWPSGEIRGQINDSNQRQP